MATETGAEGDVVHVTSKGQATIPAHLRAKYGISAPGRVRFYEHRGDLAVRAVRTPEEMMGSLKRFLSKGESAVEDLERERDAEIKDDEARVRRR